MSQFALNPDTLLRPRSPPPTGKHPLMNRRHNLTWLAGSAMGLLAGRCFGQSAADFVAGEIVKINAEQGTVTLRHDPVARLYLPAATTTFRYVDPRLITRARDGDRVRFRIDRVDGDLRLVAMITLGAGSRP